MDTLKLTDYTKQRIQVGEHWFECDLVELHSEMVAIRDRLIAAKEATGEKATWWDVYDAIASYVESTHQVKLTKGQAAELYQSVPLLLQKKSEVLHKSFSTNAS